MYDQAYYKNGVMQCPAIVNIADLKEACQYFLVPFSTDTVKCYNLSKQRLLICVGIV